jgi:hypothetical protein
MRGHKLVVLAIVLLTSCSNRRTPPIGAACTTKLDCDSESEFAYEGVDASIGYVNCVLTDEVSDGGCSLRKTCQFQCFSDADCFPERRICAPAGSCTTTRVCVPR